MDSAERTYAEQAANLIPGSMEQVQLLFEVASDFRDAGRDLAAGQAALSGLAWAGGAATHEHRSRLMVDGLLDLLRYRDSTPPDNWMTLLALRLLAEHTSHWMWSREAQAILSPIRDSAWSEYDALLSRLSTGHPGAQNLLISGFYLSGFLDRGWSPIFPGHEVLGNETQVRGGTEWFHGMQSSLRCRLIVADYDGVDRLARAHHEALTTPGLRGWALASRGLVEAASSSLFAEAAAEFAKDAIDRPGRIGPWYGTNQQVWAPYFLSRSCIGRSFAHPNEALANLFAAKAALPTRVNWHTRVQPYFCIIRALTGLAERDVEEVSAAVDDFADHQFLDPSGANSATAAFLTEIQALASMRLNDDWLSRVQQLLIVLDRIPLVSPNEKSGLRSALNLMLPTSLMGYGMGWEAKALSTITHERQLHRILLALFRAEAKTPLYSHICHGPQEYGKDLVVCRDEDGRRVLRMYSVKVGELKKGPWNRVVRPQLEEIFQVPFQPAGIPGRIDERIGVLIWNDNIHPHAQPIVHAWLADQLAAHERRYKLMHLDAVVKYIRDNRLQAVLRQALRDEGL